MTDLAAIASQVVDIQNDRQHKGFIKVTVHVPAEQGPRLTESLGWPTYTDPVSIVMARLNTGAGAPVGGDASVINLHPKPPDASASGKIRPPIPPEKRLVQQACISCTKPQFRLFLEKEFFNVIPAGCKLNNEDDAASIVRYLCDVSTRSEIIAGTAAGDKWEHLYARYIAWERCL